MAIREESKRAKEVASKAKKPKKKAAKKPVKSKKVNKPKKEVKETKNPIVNLWRYMVASVKEIKRVTWPSRKEAWRLTFAVIAFSGLLTGLAVLVDYVFTNIVERII